MKVPNIKRCVVSQGAPTLIIRSIREQETEAGHHLKNNQEQIFYTSKQAASIC